MKIWSKFFPIVYGGLFCLIIVLYVLYFHEKNQFKRTVEQFSMQIERLVQQNNQFDSSLEHTNNELAALLEEDALRQNDTLNTIETLLKENRSLTANEREMNSYLQQELHKVQHLMKKIPQVSVRLAYVEDYSRENNTMIVDYVEWLTGEEGLLAAKEDGNIVNDVNGLPNGFYIRNIKKEAIQRKVATDVEVYVIDIARSVYLHNEDLEEHLTSKPYLNLFHLYEINDTIVLMQGQYVP